MRLLRPRLLRRPLLLLRLSPHCLSLQFHLPPPPSPRRRHHSPWVGASTTPPPPAAHSHTSPSWLASSCTAPPECTHWAERPAVAAQTIGSVSRSRWFSSPSSRRGLSPYLPPHHMFHNRKCRPCQVCG